MPLNAATGLAPLILIVDDVPEDRQTFRRYLTRDCHPPYRLAEAATVAQALEAAATQRPDCVLLDFNLTDGDGLQLLRRMVQEHSAHAFGLIMLTGSGEASIAVEAMKVGAHDYVEKGSLTPGGLRRAVSNAIDKASIQRQLGSQARELAAKNEELAAHVMRLEYEATERIRAQEALTQSESFLQSIIGANTDCVKVLDLEGRLTWMNDNGRTMLEITDFSDVQNKSWPSLWPEGGARADAHKALERARGGGVGRFSGFSPTAKGTPKWWDVIVTPIFGHSGKPEKILSVSRDITKARRAEQAVIDAAVQMRAVTDHLPISIAQFDRGYRYRFANLHFTTRFGLTPENIVGKHLVDVVGQEIFNQYKPRMDRALNGEVVDFEVPVTYPGKPTQWFKAGYIPERNPAGEVVGFVAVSSDITERKNAENEVARARDEAVDATRARDKFLAALSHELRTPLNPVLLVASEAADNPALPAAVRDDFTSIRDHVELEARLIDDLLDLSRISHGKLKLDLRRLGLHAALQNAIATVKPEIDEKNIMLRVTFTAEEPFVRADSVRLQQVVWNVLKNAVKFTPAGGDIELESSVDAARRVARVRITDSGIGMTAAELPKIFDAFSQGDHAQSAGVHRFGGLGLGLAITRMLVDAHSGKLTAESAGPNRGSTFTIELPLAAPVSAPATTGLPASGGQGAPPAHENGNGHLAAPAPVSSGTRGRILLVEDHAPTRASLGSVLGRRGFQVVLAATVGEAESAARQHELDLVISDIGLPDGDGYGCMQMLRTIHPGLAGIALSGYGMDEDLEKSRRAGFSEHLIKPVNVNALNQAVMRVMGGAEVSPTKANGAS